MKKELLITPLKAFKYTLKNYIWMLQFDNEVISIDPGEANPVINYLKNNNKSLTQIWVTHIHYDHTGGIKKLKKLYPNIKILGHSNIPLVNNYINENDKFYFDNFKLEIWHTPGHTRDHMFYLFTNNEGVLRVFTGDTLFSAGAGRVFDGTIEELKNSLDRFNSLDEKTILYPAHEYTKKNLQFALTLEPSNENIKKELKRIENLDITLPVTLKHERLVNPFLRYKEVEIIENILKKYPNINRNDELSIFAAIRELKNAF